MTGRGVERQRTAVPTTSVAPVGASTLMPPHSQGAERRTERHAGRNTRRWALRTFVIGGLAGTAWLLSGAAAHATDRDPAPEGSLLGSSLIGSVVDGNTAHPAVIRVLHAVTRPLGPDRTAHQHHAASVLAVPVRALAQPATMLTATLGEATREHHVTDANTAVGAVDRVIREVTGPLRLTDGPEDSSLAPVSVPLTKHLRPVTDLLPQAVEPVTTGQGPSTAPVAASRAIAVSSAVRDAPTPSVPVAGPRVAHPRTAGSAANRQHAVVMAAEPETAGESTPGGDDPAPLQVHLGAVSGISTSGSGAPTEGGSAAFLPAAVAAGTVEFHRLPIATDVEVRRHDAEAPTVSPD